MRNLQAIAQNFYYKGCKRQCTMMLHACISTILSLHWKIACQNVVLYTLTAIILVMYRPRTYLNGREICDKYAIIYFNFDCDKYQHSCKYTLETARVQHHLIIGNGLCYLEYLNTVQVQCTSDVLLSLYETKVGGTPRVAAIFCTNKNNDFELKTIWFSKNRWKRSKIRYFLDYSHVVDIFFHICGIRRGLK